MSISHKFRTLRKAIASIASVAIFTMAVTVAPQASAQTFNDVSPAHWAYDFVEQLVADGVIDANDTYRPDDNLNRAELVKIAVEATTGIQTDLIPATPTFDDVSADAWYYQYVETAAALGIVEGYKDASGNLTGLFGPSDMVNRAAATKILVNAYGVPTDTDPAGIFADVEDGAWYYEYVTTAYNQSIIDGYKNTGGELTGLFGPGDPVTRAQVAKLAVNSQTPTERVVTDDEDEDTDEDVTESEGDLEVSVSADTPESTTVPNGAIGVEVAKFDFTAAGDDVVLKSLNVTREGVGSDSGWELYLYDGADRLTSAKSINSTTHKATFTNVNISVEAGETKTITLKAKTSDSSTGNHTFVISSEDDVIANTDSVAGDFPLKGNVMEVSSSISAGTVTIAKSGSITNPKVGEDGVTIGKFQLTTATEAGTLNSISLIVDGSISSTDVENAKLYQGGEEIASTDMVNSKDLLVFTLDEGFAIAKGDSRVFEVKADLNTGRSADTVKVYLDEDTDLDMTGGTYGYGMGVTYGSYDNGAANGDDASWSTLQGGDITISSSGPSASDIAVNGKDVALMNFSIAAGSEATFKKFAMSITPTSTSDTTASTYGAAGLLNGTTANYTDIKVINKDTGEVVMGPVDITSFKTGSPTGATIIEGDAANGTDHTTAYYLFQDEFTMEAGDELNLQITADIANNTNAAFVGDSVKATIEIDGSYPEIKDVNNKVVTNSSSVVPSSDIDGKSMTVTAADLIISLASAPVTNSYVKGTKAVCFAGFSLRAGNASDIKITSLKVDGGYDADGAGWTQSAADVKNLVGSVKLMDGDTQVGSAESVQSDGTATFDSLSYTVDAGETKLLKVCGDVSSSVASGSRGVAFAIASASNIVAEDEDGNSVTANGTANIVATTPNVVMTITQGGSLTIAVDANTPKENIAVAGTADVEISKFRISAADEAFVVNKLSINNRQSAVTAGALGDYDNNVASIQISYTNSDGDTETKTGYITNGTAQFSGLDMFIDKDEDAILTVKATLNTISLGSTAAEFVDLNVALNNFEAVAQGSGETYKASKLDDSLTSANLSIGTVNYTDTTKAFAAGAQAVTLGTSATLTTPDLDVSLPIGTIVKLGGDTITKAATDILLVLTAKYTDGDLTITGLVADNGDADADAANVWYALPGTGYLTSANRMHVYETKPTVLLATSSPSGSRTATSSDNVFVFTVAADSKEKITFNPASSLATATEGTDTTGRFGVAAVTTAGQQIDGSAMKVLWTGAGEAASTMQFATTGINSYARASFWMLYHDNTGADALDASELTLFTSTDATVASGQGTALSITDPAEDTWVYVDMAIPTGTDASDDVVGLQFNGNLMSAGGATAAADYLIIDDLKLYNEKITVNISSDASLAAAGHTTTALLKDGGTTVATGYINESSTSAASMTFVPTTIDGALEIAKGQSKTLTVQLNTATLVTDQAGTDDNVTFSINLGSSNDGVITDGDFWWNDSNALVKWTGKVDNTTLTSATLKY